MKFDKKQFSWRHLHKQEREIREGIQTTIDTSLDTIVPHAPYQVEENMPENHFRRRMGIFRRWSRLHVTSETRVRAETNGASRDAPTVIRRK